MIRRTRLAVLLVAVAVVLAACSGSSSGSKPSQLNDNSGSGPYHGVGLDPAQPRPSFTLTDTAGKSFSFGQQTAGHPTLLYFGYTNCPDVCPTTMFDVGAALHSLAKSLQDQTYVVFVTTDVKRDTGAVIHRWLSNFDGGTSAHFVGLRGTQAQINAAQTAAHITVAADDGQTHSADVLLFGSDDYARVVYPQSTNEQQQIAHDLPLVAKS
ncbi:MAG: senC [Pseudonocardiales bacterium]|nr:senC [Pseudonocardiales bacterium]